jgi:hypothetical protein
LEAGLLAAYRPYFFVSGHDHSFPYTSGQSWKQKLDEVTLLVPGQLLGGPFPNHIKLSTESRELSWHAASERWIPMADTNGVVISIKSVPVPFKLQTRYGAHVSSKVLYSQNEQDSSSLRFRSQKHTQEQFCERLVGHGWNSARLS